MSHENKPLSTDNKSRRILAVDPGNEKSAFAVIDDDLKIHAHGILLNDELLEKIGANSYLADLMVIEMVQSFGMPVGREVFETVFWIGRFCQIWKHPWHRLYRGEIKLHICMSPRAKDSNIRAALLDKLGPPGTKKDPGPTYKVSKDIWSALAIGVTWVEKNLQDRGVIEHVEQSSPPIRRPRRAAVGGGDSSRE